MIRIVIVLLIISLNSLKSQNLIPNPGFEEHIGDSVLFWYQTTGDYYHYEKDFTKSDNINNINYINGICVLNATPSEYLHIKLKEKLTKGQKYYLKMYVYKYRKYEDCSKYLNYDISCYFSNHSIDVSHRTQLYYPPQINFYIKNEKNKCNWILLESNYLAKGDEEYLTLGHFFDKKIELKNSKLEADINAKLEAKTNKYQAVKHELEALKTEMIENETIKKYPELSEYFEIDKVKNKKEKEKKLKQFNEQVKEKSNKIDNIINKINIEFQKKNYELDIEHFKNVKELTDKNPNKQCHSRFYFDNISLTPVTKNDDEIPSKFYYEKIEIGKVIELNNIFFETNKSQLLSNSTEELDMILELMQTHQSIKIEISGHTDNTGTEEHNLKLSGARAKSVADYLIGKGINNERIKIKGYGSSQPIVENKTEEGRAKNRRVEIKFINI